MSFQHSLMNLGVETLVERPSPKREGVFQHSLMNLGVETYRTCIFLRLYALFQHSLMNLGVETYFDLTNPQPSPSVSAFSDESWGGDRGLTRSALADSNVSAFSDESWGGDRSLMHKAPALKTCFSIL